MRRLKAYMARARDDRGAALITVLLLVSVMAVGAAVTFDALGYTVKRTTARRIYDQARYYALGGEQLAMAAAEKLTDAKVKLKGPQAVSYPIDAGRIDGMISDGSNCFNVNSLVAYGDGGKLVARPDAALRYRRLLERLGMTEQQATQLSATLIDWLDSDNRTLALGAEDYDYGALATPYRTANGLMMDISELRMVRGYDREVLTLVQPFLCAMASTQDMVLNVNTLTSREAPLLASLVGDDFSTGAAADAIAARPARGYDAVGDFWVTRAFSGRNVPQEIRAMTDIKASRYVSHIKVNYHEGLVRLMSEIRMDESGKAHLVRHQFGVFQ